ncbi:hypothetical protein GQR58_027493 [Nymphon striatum]|nr:hypothetical protein GQR58_027493 [Nymphon striatum]
MGIESFRRESDEARANILALEQLMQAKSLSLSSVEGNDEKSNDSSTSSSWARSKTDATAKVNKIMPNDDDDDDDDDVKASPGDKCGPHAIGFFNCGFMDNEHCDSSTNLCKCDDYYTPNNHGSCKLGGGPIAGIVIGCLLIALIIVVFLYCFRRRRMLNRAAVVVNQTQPQPYYQPQVYQPQVYQQQVYQPQPGIGVYQGTPMPQVAAQPQVTNYA